MCVSVWKYLYFSGGNSLWTSAMSDTNTQTTCKTETKIVKKSVDPPLVNGKLFNFFTVRSAVPEDSLSTRLHNIHKSICPTMKFWEFSLVERRYRHGHAQTRLVMLILVHPKKYQKWLL